MDYRERVQLWSEKLAADDPLRVELVGLSVNEGIPIPEPITETSRPSYNPV